MRISDEQYAAHIVKLHGVAKAQLQVILDGLAKIGSDYSVDAAASSGPVSSADISVLDAPYHIASRLVVDSDDAIEVEFIFSIIERDNTLAERLSIFTDKLGNFGFEPFAKSRLYVIENVDDIRQICYRLLRQLLRKHGS